MAYGNYKSKTVIEEFKSLSAFEDYICNTPLNDAFRWKTLASSTTEKNFHKTKDFAEALDLLKHGWEDMATKINNTIKLQQQDTPMLKNKPTYNVAGFQASVPRYLQGIPTSMIDRKKVPQKQKIVTIVKHIGYLSDVQPDVIIENSIKALQIVKKVEALGYRVNLDVMSPAQVFSGQTAVCRVRIKAAGERTNISKIAFPLVHGDMLRRMIFRFREVHPDINKDWVDNYGASIYDRNKAKSFLHEGEHYLHNFIHSVEYEIEQMKLK